MSLAWLDGRQRLLLNATSGGNIAVLLVAVPWVWFTVSFGDDARSVLLLTLVVLAALALGAGELLLGRAHATYRALGWGQLPATVDHRLAAIRELGTFPAKAARVSAGAWVLGSASVAITVAALSSAPLAACTRIAIIGALVGPLGAVLASVAAGARARDAINALGAGLPVASVLAAQTTELSSIRRQTVLLSAVIVALPCLMIADVAKATIDEAVRLKLAGFADGHPAANGEILAMLALRMVALITVSVGLGLVAGRTAAEAFARPLVEIAEDAKAVAGGEVTASQSYGGPGEVLLATSAFAKLKALLLRALVQLDRASAVVGESGGRLRQAGRKLETTAAAQAAALDQTSATTEELAHSARQIASSASAVQDLATKTLEAAVAGQEVAKDFAASVERMRQDNQSIIGAVERLERRVQQIGRIVEVINAVADRSDLLALSAELEGSRAGDVGRGFTLVASEMRRLAENVLESTAEVEGVISEIRQATEQTAQATVRASTLAEGGARSADDVTRALARVAELAARTTEALRGISLATQQQQSGTTQLAEVMGEILAVTQQRLDATQAARRSTERLDTLAQQLRATLGTFRVGKA